MQQVKVSVCSAPFQAPVLAPKSEFTCKEQVITFGFLAVIDRYSLRRASEHKLDLSIFLHLNYCSVHGSWAPAHILIGLYVFLLSWRYFFKNHNRHLDNCTYTCTVQTFVIWFRVVTSKLQFCLYLFTSRVEVEQV
jgi:hypothetical protein